ncbi:MAG: NAD(P)-dependent glycerol-3-phosphate dehydrogenase [Rhodospirillales bacterium]|jgi:glycerol-3-phosphate dehydrogenase (NAD(P)+)|nr:NAD(P)-dependent glycerol-3-phosphate dehydrogenase [Rhodospirillales bacterium]MBT4005891.1 NAD(P)-dependent glycerol-3-phosphate dehydrogenase [Rhodospirillales bacterium]MBT5077064.1 NAD(P)-dependent glycerol-3-phosphate dehydrogenase [Rhodospirillales bacterium]MBT5672112.1 NAD(P)-dependent glycerol-3-phosphate dehydrogenase [Rhodospirillales bacterium]MBT6187433.1 NAD(P)-dependent glycerol-3-phosphate dehydrogenase [Rhodospirillales bacterium]
MANHRINVIGGGAWGTALAAVGAENGADVLIWAREPETVESINKTSENKLYLPGIVLPGGIKATDDISKMGAGDAVLLVAPAQHMRSVTTALAPHIDEGVPAVICAKGIEAETSMLLSDVVQITLPKTPLAVLSGPTLAGEVARGKPTAVTIAANDSALGERLAGLLGSNRLRPYISQDVIGAEIGGAVKNVIAIACGIVAGLDLGQNARSALITRGLAEMTRLAVALGGDVQTLMGLSGLGDLVLTCTATDSRNYSLGLEIGKGGRAADILFSRHTVAEGAHTAGPVTALAKQLSIDMPIANAVRRIINEDAQIEQIISELLSRPFKHEI